MHLVYPGFLFALLLIGIPIIIHLVNLRVTRRIPFTRVLFLQEISQSNKARNRVRFWLLLSLRALAIASLVVAFAWPFFPSQQASASSALAPSTIIYLDNSLSMQSKEGALTSIQKAQQIAQNILSAQPSTARIFILTNDFEAVSLRPLSKKDAQSRINSTLASSTFRHWREIEAQATLIAKNEDIAPASVQFYFISDFQKQNLVEAASTTPFKYWFVPIQSQQTSNISIDSVFSSSPFWQPNMPKTVQVALHNYGTEPVEDASMKLELNGVPLAPITYSIPAKRSIMVPVTFNVPTSDLKLKFTLNSDPIQFDNTFYCAIPIKPKLKVTIVAPNDKSPDVAALAKAFAQEPYFSLTYTSPADLVRTKASDHHFIVVPFQRNLDPSFAAFLNSTIAASTNVLILPPNDAEDEGAYNTLLSGLALPPVQRLVVSDTLTWKPVDVNNPFHSEIYSQNPDAIDYPKVYQYWESSSSNRNSTTLIQLRNDAPLLQAKAVGNAFVFVSSVPLSKLASSWADHELFLPYIYRTAFFKPFNVKFAYIINRDNYLEIPTDWTARENIYNLSKDSFSIKPPQKLLQSRLSFYLENLIPESGFYLLSPASNEAQSQTIAFNYSRSESDLSYLSNSQIDSFASLTQAKVLSNVEASSNQSMALATTSPSHYWQWLLLLALICILVESTLIRAWKL